MGNVSRRSFVELALGSLVSVPAIAGGLIVAPTIALADNNPDITASIGEPEIRNYAIIDVVSPWEVGFIVRDVTRVIHTQTDDEENDCVGIDKLKEWNFNATIQVTCDGYRTFETALVRVAGGFGLIVPMHPTDIDGPYPHRVSFDEWDALYTKSRPARAALRL